MKYIAQFFILVQFILCACIEPIEIDTDRAAGILVINGRITNSVGPHIVTISRTSAVSRITVAQGGASVVLIDELGNRFPYFQDIPGRHVIPFGKVNAYPGREYHIEVMMEDGTQYLSVPERMPQLSAKDSLYYELNTLTEINENGIPLTRNVYEVFMDSEIPNSENDIYYQWAVEEAYELFPTDFPDPFNAVPPPCYFERAADPQRINVFSSELEVSGKIERRLITQRDIDYAFLRRYFSNIYQYSITREAYLYLDQIRSNINQSGSIFDIPPATIRGNIYDPNDAENEVYGFFGAAILKVTRFQILNDEIDIPLVDPCVFSPFKRRSSYPQFCISCGSVSNSVPKPEYF